MLDLRHRYHYSWNSDIRISSPQHPIKCCSFMDSDVPVLARLLWSVEYVRKNKSWKYSTRWNIYHSSWRALYLDKFPLIQALERIDVAMGALNFLKNP